MLTSAEIAQMLAAQNQMFVGQRSFAEQVGVPQPGMGGRGGMQDGAWSYAPNNSFLAPTPDRGNAFAGGIMSAGRAGLTLGGIGLGAASLFGAMGRMAPFLDPISGGLAGFRAAGMMGGLAGAALPLGLAMGAGHAANAFIGGGQQQQMIANQLGQFNFINPNARAGVGFTRDDAMAVGGSIRQLAHLPEMMTSVEELTKVLPKLKSMGVMQGLKDATEFSQRFKDSIKTIRDVSRMLGTTMEEASEFFAHSRSVGFLGRRAQLQNTLNAQFTSGLTGMNMGQVMQMQSAGADMAMQMGARRSTGAKAITNIAQQLALAQRGGQLQEGELEDITGLEGPEAVRAAATRFSGVISNLARVSPIGRLSLFGMIKFDENGKALGIDDELAQRYQNGSLSQEELKRRASSLTNAQKISATTRLSDLSMEFAGKAGPRGIASFVEGIAGDRFGSEGVNRILQMHSGMSAGEVDVFQNMVSGSINGEQLFNTQALNQAKEAALRDRTDPSAIMKRLGTRLHAATMGGLEEHGAKIFNEIGKAYDDFIDDLVGRHVARLSKEGADTFVKAMATGGKDELRKMFEASHRMRGQSNIRGSGYDAFETAVGFGVGTIAGLGVGAITGGNIFAGAAAGLGAEMGTKSFLHAMRNGDNELVAMIRKGNHDTGRSAAYEAEFSASLYGQGMGPILDMGAGSFEGQGVAQDTIHRLSTGIHGFREMTPGAKRDELRQRVRAAMGAISTNQDTLNTFISAMEGDEQAIKTYGGAEAFASRMQSLEASDAGREALALARAGIAGRRVHGKDKDFASLAIAAAQSRLPKNSAFRVPFSAIEDPTAASAFRSVEAAALAVREADKKLVDSGLSASTVALLKDRPEIRRAVRLALTHDPALNTALESNNDSEALAALAKRGIKIKPEDLESLREAVLDARRGGKSTAALEAIFTYDNARNQSDMTAIRSRAQELASELGDSAREFSKDTDTSSVSALSSALGALADTGDPSTVGPLRERVGDLVRAIQKEKDPARRSALIRAAGKFGNGSLIANGERAIGRTMSAKDLAKSLGVDYDDNIKAALRKAGVIESGTMLTREVVERAEQEVAKAVAGGTIASKGAAAIAGDKDAEIVKTMKEMQRVSGQQIELLTMLVSGKVTDEAKNAATELLNNTRPNGNAGKDGTTTVH